MIKAVGFDFDDTLVLSEKHKADLFVEIFEKKYGIKKGVRQCYKSLRGKMNRDEKIARIIKKMLKREPTKKEVKDLSFAFSKGYEYKLAGCPLVECTNILKELKKQVKFMFLLSLENKKQVATVAKHCGISKYFDEILGGPKTKLQNLKHVLDKHGVTPDETIYVGDSKGDVINSKQLKIKSVGLGRTNQHQKILKGLGADFTFSSLCEIPYKKWMKK